MRRFWRALGRVFFWSYDRMTWQYDVMVALILAFLFLTPRHWFHDQPRAAVIVQVLSRDSGTRTTTYRLDASALAPNRRAVNVTPEIQRRAHDVLSRTVNGLNRSSFQVVRVDPEFASDGSVAYYDVTVQR
ncbi:MAG TPA: hypothetical protein VNK23_03615 [Candidatus Dormibacteraeota bacterium]|nr:hypothetical protein [Candidatus Dormibacteraeota bacterium]